LHDTTPKIHHLGNYQIGISFEYNQHLITKVRRIGAFWSQTHKCWYVLYNKENYQLILRNFDRVKIIKDENNERHTKPAEIQQEIVQIAETISEIRPQHSGWFFGVYLSAQAVSGSSLQRYLQILKPTK